MQNPRKIVSTLQRNKWKNAKFEITADKFNHFFSTIGLHLAQQADSTRNFQLFVQQQSMFSCRNTAFEVLIIIGKTKVEASTGFDITLTKHSPL